MREMRKTVNGYYWHLCGFSAIFYPDSRAYGIMACLPIPIQSLGIITLPPLTPLACLCPNIPIFNHLLHTIACIPPFVPSPPLPLPAIP